MSVDKATIEAPVDNVIEPTSLPPRDPEFVLRHDANTTNTTIVGTMLPTCMSRHPTPRYRDDKQVPS